MSSPAGSSAWKSALPSSDTEVQVLPASSERISPSAGGSVEPAAGWPEPSSVSGPTKRTTSASDTSPEPSGVSSCPTSRSGSDAPSGMRNRPVLVAMKSVESAGLTVSEPTIGGSPSGSIHGTARSAAGVSDSALSSPQPATSAPTSASTTHSLTNPLLTADDPSRTSVRASAISSPASTHSSTAWARSIPLGPAITHGMPRAANRRMSAPHGTPTRRAGRPRSASIAPATASTQGWSGGVSAGRNAPPVQCTSAAASPSSSAAATASSSAARAAAGSAPTGTPRRPSNSTRSGTWLDHSPPATRPTSSG